MGIIVKHEESQKIIFYLKGADVVIKSLVVESKRGFIDEECDNLSREGLRTLVITQKYLKTEDYEKFAKDMKKANENIDNRH